MTDDWDKLDSKLAKFEQLADRIETDVAPQICEVMRVYALDRLDEKVYDNNGNPVTGNLRNSVETAGDIIVRQGQTAVSMGIESTAEYAKYIEFGTGVKGSNEYNGHISEGVSFSPKEKWYQYNPDYQGDPGKNNDPRRLAMTGFQIGESANLYGEFIVRYSQHPRPFMRPALYDNVDVFKDIIAGDLTEVFE